MIYPAYKWGGGYSKSEVDTLLNDKANTSHTHNTSDVSDLSTNYVTTNTTQTIDGTKTFLDSVFIKRSNPFLQIRSTGYVKGVAPSDNYYQGIRFYDDETSNSENHIVGGFETQYSTSGYNISNINCRNYNQNNVHLNYSVGLYVPNDNTRPIQFVPTVNNVVNLGSPSYQWNNTYTRNILIDNDINIASSVINKTSTSSSLAIRCGTNYTDGASIGMYGKDYNSGMAGTITINAYGNSDYTNLYLYPNGTMSIYNNSTGTTKNVAMQDDTVPLTGTSALSGSLIPSADNSYDLGSISYGFHRIFTQYVQGSNTLKELTLFSSNNTGDPWNRGACLSLYANDYSDVAGRTGTFTLTAVGSNNNSGVLLGTPSGNLSWSGSPIVYGSDYRIKDEIESISDEILDAWENLEPKQYKYKSDLETNKDRAEVHYGWIAQDVESVIKGDRKAEVQNGLFTHDYWDEQKEISHEETYTEEVETKSGENQTVTKTRKVIDTPYKAKGDSYGLRYTECLVVECAYLRRENKRLNDRLATLEELFKQYIAK